MIIIADPSIVEPHYVALVDVVLKDRVVKAGEVFGTSDSIQGLVFKGMVRPVRLSEIGVHPDDEPVVIVTPAKPRKPKCIKPRKPRRPLELRDSEDLEIQMELDASDLDIPTPRALEKWTPEYEVIEAKGRARQAIREAELVGALTTNRPTFESDVSADSAVIIDDVEEIQKEAIKKSRKRKPRKIPVGE